MKEHEIAQELAKLLFVLKQETSPTGNRKLGMGHRDMMMLTGICELGKGNMVKMSAISDYFHISPAAVSQCIRNFEKEGWIERVILDNDRRSVYVKVTKTARKLMQSCQDDMWNKLLGFIHFLGSEDSEHLLRIVERSIPYFKQQQEKEKS